MASKAQIVDFILENYQTSDGMPVSLSKLDSIKKSELENFISEEGESENLEKWIANKK